MTAGWSRFRALILANWPLKLTSLALAAIVWAAVAAEEPTTQLVPVSLVVLTPEGGSVIRPVPGVQAVFAGPARELLKLYLTPPVIHKTVPDRAVDSAYTFPLSPGDVEVARHVDVRVQSVEPRSVTVMLRNAVRRPGESSADVGPVSERVLMGVPVTVRGERGAWSSDPPAVIITVRGANARLLRLTRDSVAAVAQPAGSGRAEAVRLEAVAPPGVDAMATPDTVVVQRRARG